MKVHNILLSLWRLSSVTQTYPTNESRYSRSLCESWKCSWSRHGRRAWGADDHAGGSHCLSATPVEREREWPSSDLPTPAEQKASVRFCITTVMTSICMFDGHTLCTNSSIFSIAWCACSGRVRMSPASSSSSSSSTRPLAPCGSNQHLKCAWNILCWHWIWNAGDCNPVKRIIMSLASDWSPGAPPGPFSSSRGPSSISSMSAGTWDSSVTRQSAWLADLIWPDISRLPFNSSWTSEVSYFSSLCVKNRASIITKLYWPNSWQSGWLIITIKTVYLWQRFE